MAAMTLDIRTISSPDEFPEWLRAAGIGFLRASELTDEEVRGRREGKDLSRFQGAFEGSRCVGTFRTIRQELTVPGGAALPSCGVSSVTVTPTHRRRGLLSRMMAGAMEEAKERGDAVASLVAAEHLIYGRYGYGPASWATSWEVEVARTGLDKRYAGPGDGGRVDIVDMAELRRVGPELYDRYRAQPHRQGIVDRDALWWRTHTGELRYPNDGFAPHFCAVYRDADGVPQGVVTYSLDEHWNAELPDYTAQVKSLFATGPAAERALWHFVLSIDWVARVRSGQRAPDDVLPQLLPDPRAARITTQADFLWLRPLDVPRMLESRTYAAAGTLVLELHDPAGLAGGRYRLEAGEGPDGAKCVPTREDAGLTMETGALGTLYLGDESATRLAALGIVEERREGAAATADVLFRTARRPWCPDMF